MFSLWSQCHSVDQCWWAQKTSSSVAGSDQQRQVYNISAQPGDHSVSITPTDQLRDFKILDLFINNNLTINLTSLNRHLHQLCHQSSPLAKVKDSVVISFESTTSHQVFLKTTSWRSMSNPIYDISVHHWLRNVKNLGQHSSIQEQLHQMLLSHLFLTSPSRRSQRHSPASMVGTSKSWASITLRFITGRVIIHINFRIVEDVKNPIIGLDAIHHNHLHVHLMEKGSAFFSNISTKHFFTITKVITMHQVWFFQFQIMLNLSQSHHLRWSDPQYTTLDKQSASNIIAEIDDKITSDSTKIILEEESQEDLSQQAQVPHCLKVPPTPSSAER